MTDGWAQIGHHHVEIEGADDIGDVLRQQAVPLVGLGLRLGELDGMTAGKMVYRRSASLIPGALNPVASVSSLLIAVAGQSLREQTLQIENEADTPVWDRGARMSNRADELVGLSNARRHRSCLTRCGMLPCSPP